MSERFQRGSSVGTSRTKATSSSTCTANARSRSRPWRFRRTIFRRCGMATKTSPVSKHPKRLLTDEELMDLPKDGYKRELLDGEIVMSPAGSAHGRKIMRFAANFANH